MAISDEHIIIVDDSFDGINDNRIYQYIGPHSIKDLINCKSNDETSGLKIDTNGGNASHFDIVINCQIVILSPFTKVHGDAKNIPFIIFVKTNNFTGNDLVSHIRIVHGYSEIRFDESSLLDDATKMIYDPNKKQLNVTMNNRYTISINKYGLSKTSYALLNKNNQTVIPRLTVKKSEITEITSFEVFGKCRPQNAKDRYKYCSDLIDSAEKFNVLKTIHLEDNNKTMIIGSNNRDVIMFNENVTFARGNNNQDTYIIHNDSEINIIIQNYAKDYVMDYVSLPNVPRNFSIELKSLCFKYYNVTVKIEDYFESLEYQHLIFTDNVESFIPSNRSKSFVTFFYATPTRNAFILNSSFAIDHSEIILNGTSFESYADDNDLLIISTDADNLLSITINNYIWQQDKWDEVVWFFYVDGTLYEIKNFLSRIQQPMSYSDKIELEYNKIFKEYTVDLNIDSIKIFHGDVDRIGLIKINNVLPNDIKVSVDENSLVFTDTSSKNKLTIRNWKSVSNRISSIEFTAPLESITIRKLNEFGLNDIAKIEELMKKAGFNSNEQETITPLISAGVKCKISEYGLERDVDTFYCLGFSSISDQINFVNNQCSDERMDYFNQYATEKQKKKCLKMMKNNVFLNGYSRNELKKCKNIFEISMINEKDPKCKSTDDLESDAYFDFGYRFGANANNSRIEFNDVSDGIKNDYNISLKFKTDQPNGILFHASNEDHTDFIVLYLKDGYVSATIIIIILIEK